MAPFAEMMRSLLEHLEVLIVPTGETSSRALTGAELSLSLENARLQRPVETIVSLMPFQLMPKPALAQVSNAALQQTIGKVAPISHVGIDQSLSILVSLLQKGASSYLTRALLDRCRSVRTYARFFLKKFNPQTDFAEFYRKHLDMGGPYLIGALGTFAKNAKARKG